MSGVGSCGGSGSTGGNSNVRAARIFFPGNRSDIGWAYGVELDGNYKKIQCKFCEKVLIGGITRFKHHLAGSKKDITACPSVTPDVKKTMIGVCKEIMMSSSKKRKFGLGDEEDCDEEDDDVVDVSSGRGKSVFSKGASATKKSKSTQFTINHMFKRDQREEACRQIARFFYTSAIPFNGVKNPEFVEMCKLISEYGKGFNPPSYHEIREKYLKLEVERTKQYVDTHKETWKKMGCTVMSDGWTDKKKRSICNFLVNSPDGTVFLESVDTSDVSKSVVKVCAMLEKIVDDVGEENAVQVITDNAANYKLAGEMLMHKRPKLFWTPCAAHCIDLMLEDFEKKFDVHETTIARGKRITTFIYGRPMLIAMWKTFSKGRYLIRLGTTRFATSYLTLGCLHELKGSSMTLFSSASWKSSRFARLRDGKHIESIVLDNTFWEGIVICLKAANPLIRVLRLVDADDKPAMPFIFEKMNKCKEKIVENFRNNHTRYQPILDIIDGRWENQLSRPLHYAAYCLNPQFRYSKDLKDEIHIKNGLYDCLLRMEPNTEKLKILDSQLDDFIKKTGMFGHTQAQITWDTKDPASWWEAFGDSAPDLKKIVVRILSLTCSSSGCERNWSAFEMVHTKRRNRLEQKKNE